MYKYYNYTCIAYFSVAPSRTLSFSLFLSLSLSLSLSLCLCVCRPSPPLSLSHLLSSLPPSRERALATRPPSPSLPPLRTRSHPDLLFLTFQVLVSKDAATLQTYGCVLQCVAVCCSVLQCVAVCIAVHCSVLQCAAVCCSVFQWHVTSSFSHSRCWCRRTQQRTKQKKTTIKTRLMLSLRRKRSHITATHCSTLQHTAAHCSTLLYTLQHTATHRNAWQHTATHCNALQRTATHCNKLQHTATRVTWLVRMQIRDARLKRLKKLREDKKYEVDFSKSLLATQFIIFEYRNSLQNVFFPIYNTQYFSTKWNIWIYCITYHSACCSSHFLRGLLELTFENIYNVLDFLATMLCVLYCLESCPLYECWHDEVYFTYEWVMSQVTHNMKEPCHGRLAAALLCMGHGPHMNES